MDCNIDQRLAGEDPKLVDDLAHVTLKMGRIYISIPLQRSTVVITNHWFILSMIIMSPKS